MLPVFKCLNGSHLKEIVLLNTSKAETLLMCRSSKTVVWVLVLKYGKKKKKKTFQRALQQCNHIKTTAKCHWEFSSRHGATLSMHRLFQSPQPHCEVVLLLASFYNQRDWSIKKAKLSEPAKVEQIYPAGLSHSKSS